MPIDSLQAVARAVLTVESFNPRMGALQSALSSGRIDLLRNDELRSALAELGNLVPVRVLTLNEVRPDTNRVLAETDRILSLLDGS